ncbi:anoctamin-4 isoform X3 [Aethina tumida]|uniref:anoctamin-4 isoform X3 n=1 Tax=Aethina tumida TaxID=116153 RepID=UPI002147B16E|nr:anoctamin-4 isoform X3 [Aethina tumida]
MNKPVGTDFEYESVLAYIRKGRLGGGAYFKDGLKKVHYVLVLSMTSAYTNVDVISHIIRQLEDMGLEFEQDLGITIPVIFIKIHIPDEATEVYLGTYGVNEDFIYGFDYADRSESSVFKTPVQKKNVFQDIRSRELSVIKVKVIHQMLIEIPFGEGEDKRGLPKLCKRGIFQDYYPLHDGNIQYEYWYNDDLLNDRTLLAKYWANYYVWYKEQPLDLINKYYGSEIAFYFAWCAFYNMMLTPIAVLGTILSCISIGHRLMYPLDITETICNSKLPVCGLCMKGYGCTQNPLSDSCGDYTIASVLTHSILTGYAVVVTIWGICFNKMWSRKEYILKIRWNLLGKELEKDSKLRIEFQEKAEKLVMDGQIVYRLKETSKFSRRAVGIIGYILIMYVVVMFSYVKNYLYLIVKTEIIKRGAQFNTGTFMSEIHSYCQAAFQMLFSKLIFNLASGLTNIVTPKTQDTYDQIMLFMIFSLDLMNNFFPFFHTAFIKNQQFNIPFERGIGLLKNDSCDPLPCVTPLFVQLMILMTLKVILEKIFVICYPKCKGLIKSYMKEQLKKSQMPQYEEEYGKISQQFCFLDVNFSGKVIQYALLISFIYGFPLGPMCCLIQNVLSLRMEAIDMIYESRRPAYTRQSQGIGIWNTVLMTLTHVGGMINNSIRIMFLANPKILLYPINVYSEECTIHRIRLIDTRIPLNFGIN